MVRRNSWIAGVLIGGIWAFAANASSDSRCLASAKTEYERVYCQVVSEGGGTGLPSMADFRRNDASVQALLLKRPASRLGIELPASTPRPKAVPEMSGNTDEEASRPDDVGSDEQSGLNDCSLQGKVIACPSQRFQLAANLSNQALEPGVLGDDNTLGLLPFKGDNGNETEVLRYLSQAYDQYIAKMLAIGLGGATMSFTEFYHGFQRMATEGVDFARRLERTYQLLKQDKKTMAVGARFHDELPDSMEMCMTVGLEIIVCDNVATNWVYVRQR